MSQQSSKHYLFVSSLSFVFSLSLDSQKLDSCNEGGLNLISKNNNNNNSNNNRNRTTSSNYIINNVLPSDGIESHTIIKSERVIRSSSRSQCETETEKLDEQEKSANEDSQESASENEGDNNNNEDEEREEGEICEDQDASAKNSVEKPKLYKKKKRRRRKRETTLKSDQSQQIEDDDDEMVAAAIKESPLNHDDDDNDGNLSDSYINRKHSVSITRRRHSSSSDPVNLSIGNKTQSQQDDSDDANIDVETISNAPTKVSFLNFLKFSFS